MISRRSAPPRSAATASSSVQTMISRICVNSPLLRSRLRLILFLFEAVQHAFQYIGRLRLGRLFPRFLGRLFPRLLGRLFVQFFGEALHQAILRAFFQYHSVQSEDGLSERPAHSDRPDHRVLLDEKATELRRELPDVLKQ